MSSEGTWWLPETHHGSCIHDFGSLQGPKACELRDPAQVMTPALLVDSLAGSLLAAVCFLVL